MGKIGDQSIWQFADKRCLAGINLAITANKCHSTNHTHAFGRFYFWQYQNKTTNLPNINLRPLYGVYITLSFSFALCDASCSCSLLISYRPSALVLENSHIDDPGRRGGGEDSNRQPVTLTHLAHSLSKYA